MHPVGMSSRLRQAYVAAKLGHFEHLAARARHSEATAACPFEFYSGKNSREKAQKAQKKTERVSYDFGFVPSPASQFVGLTLSWSSLFVLFAPFLTDIALATSVRGYSLSTKPGEQELIPSVV
jgi:hypothetical protein